MAAQLVVASGKVMRAVYSRAEVAEGTFYVEGPPEAPTAIYARFPGDASPEAAKPEIASRAVLFGPVDAQNCIAENTGTLGHYRLIGFRFRHAANQAQRGAVCTGREGSLLEENRVEWTNGMGVSASGRGHVVIGGETSDNGQAGIGGMCHTCRLEGNTSNRNNWKGYPYGHEAGGGKFVKSRGMIVTRHTAKDNNGAGLWFDHQNRRNVVAYSHFEGNVGHGLFLELVSDSNVVVGNVFVRNHFRNNNANGSGLSVIGSSHNVIAFNTFVEGGGHGVRISADSRAQATGNVLWGNASHENAMGVSFPKAAPEEMLEVTASDLMSVWRLAPTTTVRGTAAALPSGWWNTLVAAYLAKDLDGDARPAVGADPGADQFFARRAGGGISTGPAPIALSAGWNEVVWPQDAPASTPTREALGAAGAVILAVRDAGDGLYLPSYGFDTVAEIRAGERYRIYAQAAVTITF